MPHAPMPHIRRIIVFVKKSDLPAHWQRITRPCRCGCGKRIKKYTKDAQTPTRIRVRQFAMGHGCRAKNKLGEPYTPPSFALSPSPSDQCPRCGGSALYREVTAIAGGACEVRRCVNCGEHQYPLSVIGRLGQAQRPTSCQASESHNEIKRAALSLCMGRW